MWLLFLLCHFLLPPLFLLSCVAAKKTGKIKKKLDRKKKSNVPKGSANKRSTKSQMSLMSKVSTPVKTMSTMSKMSKTSVIESPQVTPSVTTTATTTTTTTTTHSKDKVDAKTAMPMVKKKSPLKEPEEVYSLIGLAEEQIQLVQQMSDEKRRRFTAFAQLDLYEEIFKLDKKQSEHMQKRLKHESRVCVMCTNYRDELKSLAISYREFCALIPDANAMNYALTELDERLLSLPGGFQYCNETKKYTETIVGYKKELTQIMNDYKKKNYKKYKKKESEIKARNRKDKEREQKKRAKDMAKKEKELKEKEKQLKKKEEELGRKQKELEKKEKKKAPTGPAAQYEQLDILDDGGGGGGGEKGGKKKNEAKYESLFDGDIQLTAETQESIEDNFNP